MRIYTRTGDDGTTSLFGGQRLNKDDMRIEAYGTLDELNAAMGLLCSTDGFVADSDGVAWLQKLQSDVFTLGSHLATTDEAMVKHLPSIPKGRIQEMENWMDAVNQSLPELKNFLLPGGHPAISACHICRVTCRRAERRVITLAREDAVPDGILPYLNRLSDVFFMWSRQLHMALNVDEIPWKSED
jgi:cob(I)alamin adenosyltransferase